MSRSSFATTLTLVLVSAAACADEPALPPEVPQCGTPCVDPDDDDHDTVPVNQDDDGEIEELPGDDPLPNGEPCSHAEDCAAGFCNSGGTCGKLWYTQPCDPESCAEETTCDCDTGFCNPVSARCSYGDETEDCTHDYDCKPGFVCARNGHPMAGYCAKQGAGELGDSCEFDNDCLSNSCSSSIGDGTPRCGPLLFAGDACTRDEECRHLYCDPAAQKCLIPSGVQCGLNCGSDTCQWCASGACYLDQSAGECPSPFNCDVGFCAFP